MKKGFVGLWFVRYDDILMFVLSKLYEQLCSCSSGSLFDLCVEDMLYMFECDDDKDDEVCWLRVWE